MKPAEIPQELIDILDERAGKKHSREGQVLTTLAEILTKYDEMKSKRIPTSMSPILNVSSPTTSVPPGAPHAYIIKPTVGKEYRTRMY